MHKYSLCNLGLTESELLTIRSSALSALTTGKSVTSINAPGISTNFQLFANPMELLEASTYALQVLNPTGSYGAPPVNQVVGYSI